MELISLVASRLRVGTPHDEVKRQLASWLQLIWPSAALDFLYDVVIFTANDNPNRALFAVAEQTLTRLLTPTQIRARMPWVIACSNSGALAFLFRR